MRGTSSIYRNQHDTRRTRNTLPTTRVERAFCKRADSSRHGDDQTTKNGGKYPKQTRTCGPVKCSSRKRVAGMATHHAWVSIPEWTCWRPGATFVAHRLHDLTRCLFCGSEPEAVGVGDDSEPATHSASVAEAAGEGWGGIEAPARWC